MERFDEALNDTVVSSEAGAPDTQVIAENKKFDIDPSGGYEIETESFYVESDEAQIYAVLYRPVGISAPLPAVIFSHSYSDTNRDGSQYAKAFARQGYLVCCFDFRGGGMGSQSEGSSLEMSIFTEQADLETILEVMQDRIDVDSNYIFLMGNSQGVWYLL